MSKNITMTEEDEVNRIVFEIDSKININQIKLDEVLNKYMRKEK